MRELPCGTVTFLFTDIEGSTRLLQELGDSYVDALAEHRRLLRDAFQRYGGVEVDTQGDAFFVAFGRAADALAAAKEAQGALEGGPLRVRIGIHTGDPIVTEEGYVGIDVHRAARICSTAHGGQIVLSESTSALLDNPIQRRDLGLHRLKDLVEPVRLFQLGEEKFPPLRSLNATNLPVQPFPLLGREHDLKQVTASLRRGTRLLTLTGPGGAGKTRLALQAAAELVEAFRDGVFWVALAGLRDPDLVLPTIEQTLGAKTSLSEHVNEKQTLLLLDNLEHLLAIGPELAGVLARCPNLQLLTTSRAPLRIRGEREYPVPPLSDDDAVALFRARATDTEPEDALLAICKRLDGLPLAIELAAARTRVLPPVKLLERLEERLPLLTGGPRDAPERQRTLRATIGWSYDLLSTEEQQLFTGLSIYVGGFTVEAVEEVLGQDLDTLEGLVEKSLVRRYGERFAMLETIREFADGRLETAWNRWKLSASHAEYFLDLSERAAAELDASERLSVLEIEHDNLRAALTFLSGSPLQLHLAAALWHFWLDRGHLSEGRAWLKAALAQRESASAEDLSGALQGASALARLQGDFQEARLYAEEGLAAARRERDPTLESRALGTLANVEIARGEYQYAAELHAKAEAIFRDLGDDGMLAIATCNRSYLALEMGEYKQALELAREAVGLSREVADPSNALSSLLNVALAARALAEDATAWSATRDAVAEALELGQKEYLVIAVITAASLLGQTEPRTAALLLSAATRARDELRLKLGPIEEDVLASTEAATRNVLGHEFMERNEAAKDLSLEEAGDRAVAALAPL